MTTPTFYKTAISSLLVTQEDLSQLHFLDYRKTKYYNNVHSVSIRKHGPETKWTKAHDYTTLMHFTTDTGRIPNLQLIDALLGIWQNQYPGVYYYSRVVSHYLEFNI